MKLKSIIILANASFLSACGSVCENEIAQTVLSPSGISKAVVYSRNCGATTGFNTQVAVLRANAVLPDDGGNTFIANGTVPVIVQWQSDTALHISGLGNVSSIKQNQSISDVSVTYAK